MTIPWLPLSVRVLRYIGDILPPETAFDIGVDAWSRGKYETTLKEFRPLAEQGHAEAQLYLGIMYSQGRGVPKDFVQAYRWYTLAADQGDGLALKFQNLLEKSLTLEQLAEAQRLARLTEMERKGILPKGK